MESLSLSEWEVEGGNGRRGEVETVECLRDKITKLKEKKTEKESVIGCTSLGMCTGSYGSSVSSFLSFFLTFFSLRKPLHCFQSGLAGLLCHH